MPGPPPVPTAIKRIRGNPGRYPLPQDEPKPPRGVPEAPEHLSELARKAWEGFAAVLDGMNVLTQADQGSLEALCECYAEAVELRRDVALNGRFQVVVKADGGTVERLRPAYTALAEADKRLRNWMHDFGLTPAARTRLKAAPKPPEDPAAVYFN